MTFVEAEGKRQERSEPFERSQNLRRYKWFHLLTNQSGIMRQRS